MKSLPTTNLRLAGWLCLTLVLTGGLLWQREQWNGVSPTASLPIAAPVAEASPGLPPGLVADRGTPPDEAVVHLAELPKSQDLRWQQLAAEPEFAAFQQWVARPEHDVAEGVALATLRRAAMVRLITTSPERALELAVPETVRRKLPPEVAALMEERVDGRGKLEVMERFGADQKPVKTSVTRRAIIGERTLDAFVFGRREDQPTRWQIPLHGIALDGKLALTEWPARVLEPVEREEAKAALITAPICPTSQLPTTSTDTEVALLIGSDVAFYCGPAHATAELRHASAAESLLPPGFGKRSTDPVISASGGNGITVPLGSSTADAAWTTGQKKMLFVRVKFAGVDFTDMDTAEAEDVVNGLADLYTDWSYGALNVAHVAVGSKVVQTVVNLDHPVSQYDGGDVNSIWNEVKSKLGGLGYNPDNYDYLVVSAGDAPMPDEDDPSKTVWWGGLGLVGEGMAFLRTTPDYALKTALHEVGHNLGLFHSSNIFPLPFISTLFGLEYGDAFDVMGTGWGDFNVSYKHWLHWLSSAEVPFAVSDGRYTILEHDREEDGGIRGLQVPLTIGGFFGNAIFVEYRTGRQDITPLYYGAGLRYGTPGTPKTYMLDGTPETFPDTNAGRADSPLLPGRTFNYNDQLFITTISSSPDVGNLQIQVNHGPFPGNHDPTGTLTSDPFAGAPGQEVTFSVKATDADNDELSYFWDFGDGVVYPNSPTASKTWPNFGGGYKITCIVSDMKGGSQTLTLPFSVNNVSPPVISTLAAKTIDEDVPLSNVPFTVTDSATPGALISVTGASSDQSIVPDSGIVIIPNGGGDRLLTIFPAANAHGKVTITLTASDGAGISKKSFLLTVEPVTPGITLIAKESTWTYWDEAAEPEAGWNDDRSRLTGWKTGPARFVFNQGLALAPWTSLIAAPARVTTYYRRNFDVALNVYQPMLRLLCDDGAVVYLNGVEVWRQNMPAGPIDHTTHAVLSVEGSAESEWTAVPLPPDALLPGNNLLAVEVHEAGFARGSGDVSFDAQFALVQAPTVSGPRYVSTNEDTPTQPIHFTAIESESPPGALTMRITSSDPALVADDGATFGWDPVLQQNYLILTPQPDVSGTVNITLKVSDGSSEGWTTFPLTVIPVNDAPRIEPLPDVVVALGAMVPAVMIKVTDVDGPDAAISVSATSADAVILPASGLELLPPTVPGVRWLRLTPTPGVVSQTFVTVDAADGLGGVSSTSFVFRVSQPQEVSGVTTSIHTLVAPGDTWRYYDFAKKLDASWNQPGFADDAWQSGLARFGYGVLPAASTTVHDNDGGFFDVPTVYFRKSFYVADPSLYQSIQLFTQQADGIRVFINGNLAVLDNLSASAIQSSLAQSETPANEELVWHQSSIPSWYFLPGRNLIAVEIHQGTFVGTRDLAFDLQLTAILNAGQPVLHINPAGSDLELSWPAAFADWELHESSTMQGKWPTVPEPVLLDQGWLYVQKPKKDHGFFRLEKP